MEHLQKHNQTLLTFTENQDYFVEVILSHQSQTLVSELIYQVKQRIIRERFSLKLLFLRNNFATIDIY